MADNTKIGPIFRGANGGLSDDLFTGIRNSFYYSNDMEIRLDAKSIYPKPVPAYADNSTSITIGTGDTGEHEVACVTYSSNDAGWIVCTENKIYKVSDAGVVSLLCTMSDRICDMEIFNGYIYVSTVTHLYYKKDNGNLWTEMAASTNISDDDYGRCTDTLENNRRHPLYASDVCLCVGDTNKMWTITREIWNAMQDGFSIQKGYYIRFINELGGFVRVTAVCEPYGSEVMLWDKVSEAPNEVIPLDGYSIIQTAIYNGYLYLLSNKGLGLLNGYQYYLLKKVEGDVDTSTKNGMCVYDDKLYFIANNGVYIYGAKNKNYADVLNLWHHVEDGFQLGAIGAYKRGIMITRNYKYVSGGSNVPIKVGINEGLATTGEVQTMCYFGTSLSEIKQSMYLRLGYHIAKQGTNSGNIHVYYRTEADATTDNADDWSWHEATKTGGLFADWDMRSPFATTLKLNCRFQWIQFKFVLTNCVWTDDSGTHTKDTNLYSADLYYNVMLD